MTTERTQQVALVTGASRGIGAAIAAAFARSGMVVIGTATGESGLQNIRAVINAHGTQGHALPLDVTNADSISALIDAIDRLGLVPTILVNNAAITRDNLLLRMKDEEWVISLTANLTAAFRLSKALLRGMIKARRGRIINITSVVGVTGNAGQANYAASKAGIIGLTKSLAREVASRGITVNAVAPGFIDTDMTRALSQAQRDALATQIPLNRFGTAEDVAAAVAFLASDAAVYITGETLHVNGGMYMP
ncbi:MAG: 3-oxoacyl-ACP reductase FabG [Chromatiales bacterium]